MKLPLIIIFVLSCSITFAQKPKMLPLINSGEIIKEAIREHDNKHYNNAVELFTSIQSNDTNYSYALSELALTYLAMSDSVNAIRVCQEGISLNDQYIIRYYQLLGNAYHMADSIDKALATYKRGAELFPYTYKFWYEMGVLYSVEKNDSAAVKCFQKAIRLNPLNAASHYSLGAIAASNNELTPAILSLAFDALLDASNMGLKGLTLIQDIAKGKVEVKKDSNVDILHGSDNFDEIDELIRSQVAINDKYKTDVKLTYTDIVKTVQMVIEKIEYNAADTGFWMQTYVPFFKEVWKNKYFEPMMYHCFSSVNEPAVKKVYESNLKDIKLMVDFTSKFVRNKMKRDTYLVNGKVYDGFSTQYNDGSCKAIGNADPVTGFANGDWVYFYEGGVIKSCGMFDENGDTQGEWNYYFPSGKLRKKLNWKKSKFDGPYVEYFENGVIKEKGAHKNDVLDGLISIYYSTGVLSISAPYTNGKVNGSVKLYHPNGLQKTSYTSVDQEIDGPYYEYYFNGNPKLETNYTKGKENGVRTEYYSTGSILSKSKVENSMYIGEQIGFHKNGEIESKGSFKFGKKDGVWKTFYDNGMISEEENYENGIQIGSQKDYDIDGKLMLDRLFTKTEIKKYACYDKSGVVVKEGQAKGGDLDYTGYFPDGKTISSHLTIKDKLIEGKATIYYPNGVLKTEYNYVNSVKMGPAKFYFLNGNIEREVNYKDDVADGYFVGYTIHGDVLNEGWYVDGNLQGRWLYNNAIGVVSKDEYYLNDEQIGVQHYYDNFGVKDNDVFYDENGQFAKMQEFDSTGNMINYFELKNGSGDFKSVNLDKSPYLQVTYKNGFREGISKSFYPNGKVYVTKNYKNGLQIGESKNYFDNGKLQSVSYYVNDLLDSVSTSYNENGTLSSTNEYKYGEKNGMSYVYSDKGIKVREGMFKDDERNGDFIYFGDDGKTVRFRMKYLNGIAVSYSYLGKDNQYVPETQITGGQMKIIAYYPNGNKSLEMELVNSCYHGLRKYYYLSGKVQSEANFKNDDFDGVYREYHENGKVSSESFYIKDQLNGLQQTFNEQGVLLELSNFMYGSREGNYKVFDPISGKMIKNTKFIRNFPYEKL